MHLTRMDLLHTRALDTRVPLGTCDANTNWRTAAYSAGTITAGHTRVTGEFTDLNAPGRRALSGSLAYEKEPQRQHVRVRVCSPFLASQRAAIAVVFWSHLECMIPVTEGFVRKHEYVSGPTSCGKAVTGANGVDHSTYCVRSPAASQEELGRQGGPSGKPGGPPFRAPGVEALLAWGP